MLSFPKYHAKTNLKKFKTSPGQQKIVEQKWELTKLAVAFCYFSFVFLFNASADPIEELLAEIHCDEKTKKSNLCI